MPRVFILQKNLTFRFHTPSKEGNFIKLSLKVASDGIETQYVQVTTKYQKLTGNLGSSSCQECMAVKNDPNETTCVETFFFTFSVNTGR
jgi:hypothetical protein